MTHRVWRIPAAQSALACLLLVLTSGTVVAAPPIIDAISPTEQSVGGVVTITGHNFEATTDVLIGGTYASAQFTIISGERIEAIVPRGAEDGPIAVITPEGTAYSPEWLRPTRSPDGYINLAWNDCGAFGTTNQTFDCTTNSGTPFSLVGSFDPPPNVVEFLGMSATIMLATQGNLPDWWKHGIGQCRGTTGLATSFDFTSGPFSCADFYAGHAFGGFAYDVQFPDASHARLRVQAAVAFEYKGPVNSGTEYYAFNVLLQRSKSTGSGSCAGCSAPLRLELVSIHLFQALEQSFDPILGLPRDHTIVYWQDGSTAVQASLVRSEANADGVSLEWELSNALRATLYRSVEGGPWMSLGLIAANGLRRLSYDDRDVSPGTAYRYRLGLDVDGVEVLAGETSVRIPHAALALGPVSWEGTGNGITVAFTLPGRGDARLEVYDVTGRRALQRTLEGLVAGRHELRLDDGRNLSAGVYFVRLTHDGRSASTRFVLSK